MKVLLIDDEADIRKVGRLSLEMVGKFEVTTAASAAEGIQVAMTDRPDVILMDMMMPGMDGLAALTELRRSPDLAQIPVLFMTAKAQRSDIARYVALGAAGVVPKPFNPMTLPAEVRALVEAANALRSVGP